MGREAEIAHLCELLASHRFVTVTGAGGVGKTRTAFAVGAAVLDDMQGGVWLVELAPLAKTSSAIHAVAGALRVQESSHRPLLESLIAYLANRSLLLVLDNCEHVIAQARTLSSAILRSCPEVRILATSREGLGITGERVFRMPSLPVPPAAQIACAHGVQDCAAVRLFTDRACAADAAFTLTDENAAYVGEICRRLDGIPLAIELAAAHVSTLAPRQLAQRLDERFAILTNGDRTALPRQQTMQALFDWSYDLLAEQERVLFARLSVFAGGFTLEAAAAVAKGSPGDELVVLQLLSSLVAKSLLVADAGETTTRYRLLESTRQYASGKLLALNETDAIARAHATAYTELAERLEQEWDTMPERRWLAAAEPELENWRAALTWALGAQGSVALAQRLAAALRLVWSYLGAAEGRRWVGATLATVDDATPSPIVAKLELADAHLAAVLGHHHDSHAQAQRALARYRAADDALGTAEAQRRMGRALLSLGRNVQGEHLLEIALTSARALNAHRLSGMIVASLALARQADGDLTAARALCAQALTIYKATAAEWQLATLQGNMAELEFRAGDHPAALQLASAALGSQRAQNGALFFAQGLCNIAAYLVALGRHDEARDRAAEALAAAADMHHPVLTAVALQHLAAAAVLQPGKDGSRTRLRRLRAARLLGCVDARLDALATRREFTEAQEYDRTIAALRDALGSETLADALAQGRQWCEEEAATEATSL